MELKPYHPNLRECPFCGSADLHVIDNVDDFFIGCDGCNTCGPSGDTPMDAVEAWNCRVEMKGEKIMNNTTNITEKNTQTRGDRIRAMSDEELAWELMEWRFDARAKAEGSESGLPDTQKSICEWLKQAVQ